MDESNPLIQQNAAATPWYKRRVFIISAAVCTILALVAVIVTVATCIVFVRPISKCSYSNSYDCVTKGFECQWCYTDKDGSGYCEGWRNDPNTGYTPLTCSPSDASMCMAYGFFTKEVESACISFSPYGRSDTCHWKNPYGNCYKEDPPYGPIGCCWDSKFADGQVQQKLAS